MMRPSCVQILLVIALACLPPTPAPTAQPKNSASEWQEVILLRDKQPVRLRLQVRINGGSFTDAWNDYLNTLFVFLDVNRDGKLQRREWTRAPHPQQLVQMLRGEEIEPGPAPEFEHVTKSKTANVITRLQLKEYYQNLGIGPFFVEYGLGRDAKDELSQSLFAVLDTDKDGKLSEKELRNAPKALRKFDLDENELVTIPELGKNRFFGPPFAFQPLHEAQKNDKRMLLPSSAAEAKRLGGRAVLQVTVDLGSADDKKDIPAGIMLRGKTPAIKTHFERSRALVFAAGGEQFKLFRGQVAKAKSTETANRYLSRFQQRDDGDGFLDTKEIYRPPFEWTAVLRLADNDLDERISRKELEQFVAVVKRGAISFMHLTVADRTASLFEMIDADHDGRLSRRDLNEAWQQLKRWDKNGDGFIKKNEIPRQIHLVVSAGSPLSEGRQFTAPGYGPARRTAKLMIGPRWFRLMDDNGDGDVSPREFLGNREAFRRIDRDGDGLIDVAEARKARD